jgi:hypothetical protein
VSLIDASGPFRARETAAAGLALTLSGPEGAVWTAAADAFTAYGLDASEALGAPGALPGAFLLRILEAPETGGLVDGIWRNYDSLLTQKYSAGSWKLEGFSLEGPDMERARAASVGVTGPMAGGAVNDTRFEARGVEVEFPAESWHSEYSRLAKAYLGANRVRADITAWKSYDAATGALDWNLETLDVEDLARLTLKIGITGLKAPEARALSAIPVSDIGGLAGFLETSDIGIRRLELTISGRPAVDRAVLMAAESMGKAPSDAMAEMTSKVSLTLIYTLSQYVPVEPVLDFSEAVIDYIRDPGTITFKMEPAASLNRDSMARIGGSPGAMAEFLNISVATNGNGPVSLTGTGP